MSESGIQVGPGDTDKPSQQVFTNRSGVITAEGDVLTRDLLRAAPETTTTKEAYGNVVDPATANLRQPVAVAQGAIADDATGIFVTKGRAKAKVNGTVAVGDFLKAVNAQRYLQACAFGAASTEHAVARAVESNSSGTNVKEVILLDSPFERNV